MGVPLLCLKSDTLSFHDSGPACILSCSCWVGTCRTWWSTGRPRFLALNLHPCDAHFTGVVWNQTYSISEVLLYYLRNPAGSKSVHAREPKAKLHGHDVSQYFKGRTWLKLERCQKKREDNAENRGDTKKGLSSSFSCSSTADRSNGSYLNLRHKECAWVC